MKISPEGQVDPLTPKSISAYQGSLSSEVGHSDLPVLLIVNLVLQTAFLKSCPKPISLLLLGPPGIGKSRLLSPLTKVKEVGYVNDITPKYLVEFLGKVKNGGMKFLAVPDFTNCMSHGKNTRTTLVAILRSMTEEGVVDLSDYHLEFKADKPVQAGLITATTHSSYETFKRRWKATGFLSRLLPFSFNHSVRTTGMIMDAIEANQADPIGSVKFLVKRRPKAINRPGRLLRQLRAYEMLLSKSTDSLPYRHQIQLNAVAEAATVLRGDTTITQEDIDLVAWLSNWINYSFNTI